MTPFCTMQSRDVSTLSNAATASSEWQHLFHGGSNSPTCGMVVTARGADFAPAAVTVNGAPAKVLVQAVE